MLAVTGVNLPLGAEVYVDNQICIKIDETSSVIHCIVPASNVPVSKYVLISNTMREWVI